MNRTLLTGVATMLLCSAAAAADLPRRAPPPVFVPPPLFSWTGVYIGTHTAYTFTDRNRITTVGNDPTAQLLIGAGVIPGAVSARDRDGFANFGGGFGINYQFTAGSGFVIGAAVDADWTDLHKNTVASGGIFPVFGVPVGFANVYEHALGYLATANGRIGYAFDRFLVYGTGGVAIGKVEYAHSLYITAPGVGTGLVATGGNGATEIGYNYGGGIEYAIPKDSFLGNLNAFKLLGIDIGGNVTLKAEYIHFDLGGRNVLVTDTLGFGISANSRFKTEGNIVRAGFTYKFP